MSTVVNAYNEIVGTYEGVTGGWMGDPRPPMKHKALAASAYSPWINAYPAEYRPCLKELTAKIVHVSYETFVQSLEMTVSEFLANKPTSYVALVQPEKSQKWVTEIAMRMGLAPSVFLCLGEEGANNLEYSLSVWNDENLSGSSCCRDYIIVDDGSYSGNQMANNISAANRILRNRYPGEKIKFHVLIPYLTRKAHSKISDLRSAGIKVCLYHHVLMDTVKESVSARNLQKVKDVLWPDYFSPAVKDERASSTALYWFDHKIPNSMSFPEVLEKGMITRPASATPPEPKRFLPIVHPPYKPEEEVL